MPGVKVLLVVIDAASPRVMCPAVQTGRLPNLKRLAESGSMHERSTTIFPSITPAATSSIITGAYPSEHGIAGASWYEEGKGVAYYGDDFWTITKEGYGNFLEDFLRKLNGDRLTAPTLFEMVEHAGLKASCVNYLIYKGNIAHKIRVPPPMALLPGVKLHEEILGPSTLCLGDFVTPHDGRRKVKDRGGLMHRFGMDDESGADMLRQLAEDDALGDFALAYFADNDYCSHEVGPFAALPVLDRVDAALGAVFDAAGGFERFTRDTCVIVTSDHGHSEILADSKRSVIQLDRVLGDLKRADIARGWRTDDDIMICPNMRAAQIYVQNPTTVSVDRLVQAALADTRIDLALWHRRITGADSQTYVVESRRGRFEFSRGSGPDRGARDAFGTVWNWRGDLNVLGLDFVDDVLDSCVYPNPLERIAGVLDHRSSGDVWLTAEPGCEFEVSGGDAHAGGGSHGALHALDSLSPVIIGGATAPELPRHMRSVDIAPLCMELLGLSMKYRVGQGRP
ncbi:MAG TPA: alkaline phosphatase family protein [Vicinamibacterales bacterium]|nr:alkaline phosphatase family protein [Vicinamibacterales bacterium]